MTTLEKLDWLRRNSCTLSIEMNEHRVGYETVEQALESEFLAPQCTPEGKAEILAAGQIVIVQVYPDTPIGFFVHVHHNIAAAVDEAYDTLREVRGES